MGGDQAAVDSLFSLNCISPVDGRYATDLTALRACAFTEKRLIQAKALVEVKWLAHLVSAIDREGVELDGQPVSNSDALTRIIKTDILSASQTDAFALRVKAIEKVTKHDSKAVELAIKELLVEREELKSIRELTHMGLTSEDVTGSAYALMFASAWDEVLLPQGRRLLAALVELADDHKGHAMMSLTHGQAATPTTFGKEIAVFLQRLIYTKFGSGFAEGPIGYIKFGGAVGTHAGLTAAWRTLDWINISREFVHELHPHLELDLCTTQIPNREWLVERLQQIQRANAVLLDLSRDMWLYTMRGILALKTVPSEVGSSTMPHKVNPIHFENAEGNLEMSISLTNFLAGRLTQSRMQRDLSDSTLMRNLGNALGYTLLAWKSLANGIGRVCFNAQVAVEQLSSHFELLGEPIQCVLRKYPSQIADPYDVIKHLTRGASDLSDNYIKTLVEDRWGHFLSADDLHYLCSLTPHSYIGKSYELTSKVIEMVKKQLMTLESK